MYKGRSLESFERILPPASPEDFEYDPNTDSYNRDVTPGCRFLHRSYDSSWVGMSYFVPGEILPISFSRFPASLSVTYKRDTDRYVVHSVILYPIIDGNLP